MQIKNDIKLHLGCGRKKIHGFINIDGDSFVKPDLVHDISKVSEIYHDVSLIYNSHVLEHFPRKEIYGLNLPTYMDVLQDWYKALKVGGILRISVPNFEAIVNAYRANPDINLFYGLVLGGQRSLFDIHYNIFDFKSLKKDLEEIGFKNIRLYDRWETEHAYVDDYSAATLLPAFDRSGMIMSLNIEAEK